MNGSWLRAAAALLGLAALAPTWFGLSALDRSDYLGGALGLAMAWLLARTALDLGRGPHDPPEL